eukprot:3316600-Amphidinium_carterae.1
MSPTPRLRSSHYHFNMHQERWWWTFQLQEFRYGSRRQLAPVGAVPMISLPGTPRSEAAG